MKLISLVPHPVNIIREGQETITFPKCELAPRLTVKTVKVGEFEGIPLTSTKFGEVENLPEPQADTKFIVSRMVLATCPNRNDLVVPNELVRNEKGQPIGCKSLAVN